MTGNIQLAGMIELAENKNAAVYIQHRFCLSCCRQASANMLSKSSNDAPGAGVLGDLGLC